MKYTLEGFADEIRKLYPGDYDDLSDEKLVKLWLKKYPNDSDKVSLNISQNYPNQSSASYKSSSFPYGILIILIIGILSFLSNPSESVHKGVIKTKMNEFLKVEANKLTKESTDSFAELGNSLGIIVGGSLVNVIVDETISVDNYHLFSLTKITYDGETKIIGIGVFGNIFLAPELNDVLKKGLPNN
jgi:hypothetical protein